MIPDAELLRCYAESRSEEAFAEIVRRYLNLVYFTALRRTSDGHLAEDITQVVFTTLARQAASLARHPVLTGWLYTTTRFTAAKAVRTAQRRKSSEQEAGTMNELFRDGGNPDDWEKLRPVIDDALDELDDRDREAVLMRCLEHRRFAEIGAALGLSEDTARKRVERALDKLRTLLERRGLSSTTAALAAALANQAGVAAPAGLAASVTGAALAGSAATAGAGLATFMSITKLQAGIVGVLALAGAAGYLLQAETNAGLRRDLAAAREQQQAMAALRMENQRLATVAAEVEMLRRDDAQLQQLAQRVAEIKRTNQEKARLAQARTQDRRKAFEDKLRADDQKAQEEIDRMNREANQLVKEFKALSEQAKDPALTPEARANAEAAAQASLATIKRRRDEIRVFSENVQRSLTQRLQAFRSLMGDDPNSPPPALQTGSGRLELRRDPADGTNPADNPPPQIRADLWWLEAQGVPANGGGPDASPPPATELKPVPNP
ncbi:MAG: sigma-70 family RNA polymerase sigma factor [Verrucomicrobia bacterium]|nr:sigma-70 family RNA polymerase sigma factor [Verrucomicrobiota bacterium]